MSGVVLKLRPSALWVQKGILQRQQARQTRPPDEWDNLWKRQATSVGDSKEEKFRIDKKIQVWEVWEK